jgi:hypothetical protein
MTQKHVSARGIRVLGGAVFGARLARADLHPERQKLLNKISRDPWEFLMSEDPITREPLVWTRNENSPRGRDPFPDKEYLRLYINELRSEPVLFVPKSRQMMVSTATLVLCLWETLFEQSWRAILSKVVQEDAEELLENKVRFTYRLLPEWLRGLRRVSDRPKSKVECAETASYILAAAQNVADREARGGTANRVVIDEACYQDFTQRIFEACQPMTQRLVVITTPNVSYPGGRFVRKMIFSEQEDI